MTQYPSVDKYYANGNREWGDLFFLSLKGKAIINKKPLNKRSNKRTPETLRQKQQLNNDLLALNDTYFVTLQKMSKLGKEVYPISEYY